MTKADIVYTRQAGRFKDAKGVEGIRGTLKVGGQDFPAIERGGNYRRLPNGIYGCEMAMWTNSSGAKKRAIRVKGAYSRNGTDQGRIYIHPSNQPNQLAGCIAPGKARFAHGVTRSVDAITEIFALINSGGWKQGQTLSLKVC